MLASNFTGQFTASNNGWTYSKSNNLEFVFTDQYGKECILKLQTSGDIKKVYAGNIEEWKDYKWEENSTSNGYTYTSNDYYDYTACTIGVPENIVVTLTQNSKEVIKTTVKTDLSSITGEHFDIAKSNVTVSALVEINNGYKVNVSQAAYTGNTKGSVSTIISKNGTNLVTIGVSADVNNLPSVNIDAFSSHDFDEDKYNWDDVSGKNAFVKLDICGRVQIQGTISDVVKYADYLDDASDNDTNERNFKSYINQANSLSDVNLFYDGKSERQANIILEPFIDETWNGTTYWIAEPVIYFFDGSSYSSFEAFFNDTDFKATIDAFNNSSTNYGAIDPSLRLSLSNADAYIAASYALRHQYLSQTGFTDFGMPTEFWIASDSILKPQYAHSISIEGGTYIANHSYRIGAEVFYKRLYHQVAYNGSVVDYVNTTYDLYRNMIYGNGENYGFSVSLNKCSGKLNGWISYAYTHARRRFDRLSKVDNYPTNHERPHEFNAVATYELNKHWSFGGTFVYASGTSFTAAESVYLLNNNLVIKKGEYNGVRLRPYVRMNLSANYKWKCGKRNEHCINLSVYNATRSSNDLFYFMSVNDNNEFRYKPMTFAINIMPSISYTYKF